MQPCRLNNNFSSKHTYSHKNRKSQIDGCAAVMKRIVLYLNAFIAEIYLAPFQGYYSVVLLTTAQLKEQF